MRTAIDIIKKNIALADEIDEEKYAKKGQFFDLCSYRSDVKMLKNILFLQKMSFSQAGTFVYHR